MDTKNIVVVGSSGHARVVLDIIEKQGNYNVVGLIDPARNVGDNSLNYAVVGADTDMPLLVQSLNLHGCFIAIGDNWQRHLVARKIFGLVPELEFITAIHPSAQIARGVTIGRGTAVMAGAIINSASRVGDFCIINTKASLDHDGLMEDFSSLAPNATTGGNVRIGEFSAISLGANIIHGRTTGKHSLIGAGALVLEDVPDFAIAYGIPAKVVGKRQPGDKYL